jgi:peptide/nickel transport system permease protein
MSFLFRQFWVFALTIWLAVTLAFFTLRLLPGDAIQAQLSQNGVSDVIIEQRRALYGLTDPPAVQYVRYLFNLIQGNLGYSLVDGQPVTEMILRQIPPTFSLAIGAIAVGIALGLTLGIIAAISSKHWIVTGAQFLMSLSLSMPIYWTGTLAIFLFSTQLGLLPSTGSGRISQLIMPVAVLGFQAAGSIGRLTETSVRSSANADFVVFARAKGVTERIILWRHILRVGLLPTITAILLQIGFLLSGTVITENLFVRPGLGRLLLDRVLQQDYPAVQGIVVLFAVIYASLNLFGDLIYPLLDPRVTYS